MNENDAAVEIELLVTRMPLAKAASKFFSETVFSDWNVPSAPALG